MISKPVRNNTNQRKITVSYQRHLFLLFVCFIAMIVLSAQSILIQNDSVFLQDKGKARYLRTVSIPVHRGIIVDRHNEPLAISTPVNSIWFNPEMILQGKTFSDLPDKIKVDFIKMSQYLGISKGKLISKIDRYKEKEFIYLKRHLLPFESEQIMQLNLPGVFEQREYRRFYPTSEVFGHVLGFTNIDDRGQEGIELAYDDHLRGYPGKKKVIRNGLGHKIKDVERIRSAKPGKKLVLSLSHQIQFLAYRELKKAVKKHQARAGSLILLHTSGEILAMVNQPAFNPNNRNELHGHRYRNRAITDIFEPGSTLKPFIVAAGLEADKVAPYTLIDTSPGTFTIGDYTIRDPRNYGIISVSKIIQKSSNVGAGKLALMLKAEQVWDVYSRLGFGLSSNSGFPGEASGRFNNYKRWYEVDQVALAYGYGISMTLVQLAQAYNVIANEGKHHPITFLAGDTSGDMSEQILTKKTTQQLMKMLVKAVGDHGTGQAARVPGYSIAGKTGTVHKSRAGGYSEDRYISLFAGIAPAKKPQLVCVVLIDEPKGDYYGGIVAAPVFSSVVEKVLRLMNIPPDFMDSKKTL